MQFKARKFTAKPWRTLEIAVLAVLGLSGDLPAATASANLGEPEITRARALTAAPVVIAPGQVELRRYSREPGTVIVGDAEVAVASIVSSKILVLTGLQPGETNVIVLDDGGDEIDQVTLRVVERGDTVVVRRGLERQLLRCDPACAPLDEPGLGTVPSRQTIPEPQGIEISATGETASGE